MKMSRLGWLAALLLAGCAEVAKKPPEPVEERAAAPAARAGEKSEIVGEAPKVKPGTARYLASRGITLQATRPINVRSSCSQKDDIGTLTKLALLVEKAEVKEFDAQVTMKGHGTCHFNLSDFAQVEKMPQVLLRHNRDAGCTARMWEQGEKVTIAFSNCHNSCERDAFSYLWPIMVEAKSGRCF